jgi:hypothetical protein
MKQTLNTNRSRIEEPLWCDHCRVRIAPYEKAATAGTKAFHADCFRKLGLKESSQGPFDEPGLTMATA